MRHARSAAARSGSATATVPRIEVAVAGEVLGRARHRVVGAELQRALAQRARQRVVDGDDRALGVGLGGERARSSTSSPGFEGDSSPHERRTRQRRPHRVVGGGHEPHLHPVGREHVAGDRADARIGVRRSHEHVAGMQRRDDHGARGRHPRGEDDALGALELAERILQARPRRVVVAPVVEARGVGGPGEVVGRREGRARQERLAVGGRGQAGVGGARGVAPLRHLGGLTSARMKSTAPPFIWAVTIGASPCTKASKCLVEPEGANGELARRGRAA